MFKEIKSLYAVIFSAVLFFTGCGKESNTDKESKEEKHSELVKLSLKSIKEIGLQTETVSYKPFIGIISIPAKVLPNQDNEALVGSLLQGRVNKVFVKVGDFVKTGQTLMNVEGLEIGEIKAGFLTAKANLEYQKANYERQKTLVEQKAGSQKSFLEAKAEYEKALAGFNAEDKKIHSIGLTDEEVINGKANHTDAHTSGVLPVKAPISGIIIERNVVIGQSVDAATNAFKIINTNSVWIDGQVYEKDINKINNKTDITFTASSYPDDIFHGKITYIGQTIDEKSRTITIRAEFKNPNGKLKPQMFGEMRMNTGGNSMTILIPAESVFKIDNSDFVFIQENDTTFRKQAVVIGSSRNEVVEIKDGIKENEKVVTKGTFYLKSELLKDELEED